MPRHGKRYRQGFEAIEADKAYGLSEAIAALKAAPVAKFDEMIAETRERMYVETRVVDIGM